MSGIQKTWKVTYELPNDDQQREIYVVGDSLGEVEEAVDTHLEYGFEIISVDHVGEGCVV